MNKIISKPRHGKTFTSDQIESIDEQFTTIIEEHVIGHIKDVEFRSMARHELGVESVVISVDKCSITVDLSLGNYLTTPITVICAVHRFYKAAGFGKRGINLAVSLFEKTGIYVDTSEPNLKRYLAEAVKNVDTARRGTTSQKRLYRSLVTIAVARPVKKRVKLFDHEPCDEDLESISIAPSVDTYYWLVNDDLRRAVDKYKSRLTAGQARQLIKDNARNGTYSVAEVLKYGQQTKLQKAKAKELAEDINISPFKRL